MAEPWLWQYHLPSEAPMPDPKPGLVLLSIAYGSLLSCPVLGKPPGLTASRIGAYSACSLILVDIYTSCRARKKRPPWLEIGIPETQKSIQVYLSTSCRVPGRVPNPRAALEESPKKGRRATVRAAPPVQPPRNALLELSYKKETITWVPSFFLWSPMIWFELASL